MASFLPPETADLERAVVERNARRARALRPRLAERSPRPGAPGTSREERRRALAGLDALLRAARGADRTRLFYGPRMRAWLHLCEEGLALGSPAATPMALFERIAGSPHITRLLPAGRVDRAFPRRAAKLGNEQIETAFRRLPSLLAFRTPSRLRLGPFPLDLEPDAEEARIEGEVHLDHPTPVSLRLPPGSRLAIEGSGIRLLCRGPVRWIRRERIEGSEIVVARRARWSRGGALPGAAVRGAASRLAEALALLDLAWPEAGREVRAQTFEIVPLVERGTVSYSLPARPGCSYINLRGKSLVDLADDLLHESAHHRLHGLEEIAGALDRDDGEPRYRSPWRRSIRPLHGLVHAAYTFAWRAALLRRLLDAPGRLPRAWIARELRAEKRMLREALRDLDDARRRSLLTRAGAGIVESVRARVRRLS